MKEIVNLPSRVAAKTKSSVPMRRFTKNSRSLTVNNGTEPTLAPSNMAGGWRPYSNGQSEALRLYSQNETRASQNGPHALDVYY